MARRPSPSRAIQRGLRSAVQSGSEYIPDIVEKPLRRALDLPDLSAKPPKKKSLAAKTQTPAATPATPPATTERAAPSLSVPRTRSKPKPVVKALPAPPKPLALPAPGPGLPEFAAKPRGGQWWADKEISDTNWSPENAARQIIPPGILFSSDARDKALREWWERAVPKYIKNDFASPNDPLRDLAERGLLHIPDTDADTWSQMASESFSSDPLQEILFPKNRKGGMPGAGDDLRGEIVSAMPWLTRVPATDELYGVNPRSLSGLDFPHIADEMRNAMSVAGDIPADLAVRPESLARMSFPQAVERVGRINQFRAKEMERAALSNLNSPAIQTFKEYADDNPMGLRWVELRAPDPEGGLPEGWQMSPDRDGFLSPEGEFFYTYPGQGQYDDALQDALQYEGDTMGHCVGGYCDNVMGGRSRIFSLRDAKGEPHVTIETSPGRSVNQRALEGPVRDLWEEYVTGGGYYAERPNGSLSGVEGFANWAKANHPGIVAANDALFNPPENIVQIKGKQNRAPKDDYLPFVQDFVKSQQWGNVGDLRNTNLVRLPDGRYLDNSVVKARLEQRAKDRGNYNPEYWERERSAYHNGLDPDQWDQLKEYFEGYAIGGRVDADRCFCRHPMSVRKKK